MLVNVRPSNRIPPLLKTSTRGSELRLPFTARIERALFHRARSASKKGTWSLPSHPSEGARSGSKESSSRPCTH